MLRKAQIFLLIAASLWAFQDLEKHWAKEKVEKLVHIGAIKGYDIDGDGQGDVFRPNGKVTRAEFLTILSRALGWIQPNDIQAFYEDVKPDAWFSPFILNARTLGIIPQQMVHKNKFMPNRAASRAEIAAMMEGLFAERKKAPENFKDLDSSHWAYSAVMAAVQNGIVKGYPDNTFKPEKPVTRAEASVMVIRLMENLGTDQISHLQKKLQEKLIRNGAYLGFTGLVLDCRGFPLQRSQSTSLYDEQGKLIYPQDVGAQNADILLEKGAFRYAKDFASAEKTAGIKPLVIKCIKTQRAPGVKEGPPTIPVISVEDSQTLQQEGKKAGFLKEHRVVIVY